jgi:hypothetical protein
VGDEINYLGVAMENRGWNTLKTKITAKDNQSSNSYK